MRRFGIPFTVGLALAATSLMVSNPAGAEQRDGPKSDPTVEVSETGSYIVVMEADPLVAEFATDELATPRARGQAKKLAASHDEALEAAGADSSDKINDYTNALNGFSALLSHDEAEALAGTKGVLLVMPDELHQLETDSSGDYLGLSAPAGPWATGVTGEDVVVGVIDSGIWPEHPSFADDGSYGPSPIPPLDDSSFPVCDFGNTAHNVNDAPFTCNNKLLGARQVLPTYRALIGADPDEYDSARDDDGHGTHTASTAAGNAGVEASIYGQPLGTVSGIAPRARVIAYKGLGTLGGFTSDLAASIDQAVADGVDVINYSIGGGAGALGADDIAFLFAADAGVHVATSAGNSGPGPATVGSPAWVPWLTSVGANTQSRFFQGRAVLGDGSEVAGASITPGTDGALPLIDAEDAGGDLCIPGTLDPAKVTGNVVLCRRGAIARADKSLAVSIAGGAGMIMYNNVDTDNLYTDTHWVPSVHIDNTPGLEVKAYIATATDPTADIVTGEVATWDAAPSMTYFSSRGPNPVAEDIIKPDITGPGLQILAGNSPTPLGGYQGELFQAIAGTSMSSPHIAGIMALMDQAQPGWSPAAVKSALMTTANPDVRDNDRVSPATPFGMGSGEVAPGSAVHKGSAFQPGLVYDAGFNEYLGFLCDAGPYVFTDPAGTCGSLDSIGIPTDATDLNYPSIGISELAGSKTVVRTVTSVAQENGWRDYTVDVEAPPGYSVTVSPSTLRLKSGDSATYEVTITNDGSAPVGEWRFGSLTWNNANYSVRSPIAVRGALFEAPASVSGEGATGSGSFDVGFGYTGDYSAAPHGLTADAPTSGFVGQDPDQTYPSGDDAPPGVQKIDFPVSGSAFVRWEMVIPGADDIDLFLEDSSGTIIASSTSGGTDELIELTVPADDTYTMVVHGWSVPNEPLPFTLHFWSVPLASGGSLSVDAAPTAAVTGESGTIDYSWSGLGSGPHLGAISHSNSSGLMGLTLVEVDVP